MTDIESVRKLFEAATVAGGVDDGAIVDAERKLGIQFPHSYRQFLSHFGAASCSGFEIAGLFDAPNHADEPPLWSDVVISTLQIRRFFRGMFPNEYVKISDNGMDHKFYLDTSSSNAQGDCPVIALGPGADAVIVANDFFDFVRRSFAATLSY
jgi:hypothetical protein